jgi:thiamine pyrophosphate-dependent acetolactate synthase large subunit-like protein
MASALGFALAYPARRIVSIVGDGVFQFGIQTLWSAAHLGLPITFVVIDNASYAAVRAAVKRYRGTSDGPFPASDIGGIDIAAAARGFGAKAWRVDRLQDLVSALDAAGAHAGPSVIDVHTDPHDTGPA